jgi:DNA (cytosine-5)-methyltransferase 1
MDYGLEAAGFATRLCLDLDHDACETIRRNRDWRVVEGDIDAFPSTHLLDEAGLGIGQTDLLAAGPPCQPFSKSGYWAGGDSRRLADPRAGTLHSFLRVLEDTAPRAFLFENVRGFAFRGKNEAVHFLLDQVQGINSRLGTSYRPVSAILRASDYGVPQVRERFFLVAERSGQEFVFPEAGLAGARNAWDAIADVKPDADEDLSVHGRWAELLPSIPEGLNYLWHTDRGGGLPLFGWRRRYWSFLLKLARNRPAWTIQAQPGPAIGPFHWDNRRLSRRELCRLQTFPDDVDVFGSLGSVQKQVGNAVPSLLVEILGREIRSQLLGSPVECSLNLLPPDRSPSPDPTPAAPVPERYLSLAGDHAPHPGTGLGFLAARQMRLAV